MADKRPRWESEMMGGKDQNPRACMACMFAQGGETRADSAFKGHCMIYERPEIKPTEVYFDGADCEYYEKAL
jgi:hypothetical protein